MRVLSGVKSRQVVFVSTLIGAVASAIAIYSFVFQRNDIPVYRVQLELLSSGSFVNHSGSLIGGKVEVRHEGVLLMDPKYYAFQFRNVGNQPITKDMVNIPLTISFPESIKIIGVSVNERVPAHMNVEAQVELRNGTLPDDRVIVRTELMNPGNSYLFTVLADHGRDHLADYRIKPYYRSVHIDSPVFRKRGGEGADVLLFPDEENKEFFRSSMIFLGLGSFAVAGFGLARRK